MKKKRIVALLTILAMVVAIFVACGTSNGEQTADAPAQNDESTEGEEVAAGGDFAGEVLTLLHYFDPNDTLDPYSVGFMALLEQFEEETGITVNLETVPWDEIESVLVMTNQSGNPTADISWVGSQRLASLVNAGALLPLDDFYESIDTSDFVDVVMESATHPATGSKYILQLSIHSRGLWYNREMVPTPPATWDELVEMAIEANDPDNNVFGFVGGFPRAFAAIEVIAAPWAWSAGGYLANPDGSAAWDNDGVERALQFISDLHNVHGVMPESAFIIDRNDLTESFRNGNFAMTIDGTHALAAMMESELGQAGLIGFAPIPGENGPAPGFTNGWSMAIPSNSRQPELAMEFMRFMIRPDIQIAHSKFDGGLPIINESFNDEFFTTGLYPEIISNVQENSGVMDPFVYYSEALNELAIVTASFALDPTQDLRQMLIDSAESFNRLYFND
jgi:multiple sugar transport system substrate-binding protein